MRRERLRKNVPSERRRILIYGEGKTEALYFKGLCGEDKVRRRFAVTPKEGTGGDARITVNAAIDERNRQEKRGESYDEVWCVLDVEDTSRRENVRQAVALAKKEGVSLAVSNPSFEVWLIAHFECIGRSFQDSGAAENYLNHKHWKTHYNQEYDKADAQLYSRLADRVDTAVTNARWTLETHHANELCVDCNSSTDVYRFVEYLRPVREAG